MGLFGSLFGGGNKNSNGKGSCNLNKNNVLDVCYAFGTLAGQVGSYERSYVQVKLNPNNAMVQVILDKNHCEGRGVRDLNVPQDLVKLGISIGIANFIATLNGEFKNDSGYVLDVYIPLGNEIPKLQEITDSILRSQGTVRLPVNYSILTAQNGVVLVQMDD